MAQSGRERFAKAKPILNVLAKFYRLFPMGIRKKLFLHYRNKKGTLGIVLRYVLLSSIAKDCGDNVGVREDCYILSPQGLTVGHNVSIHPMCYIDATGEVEIGDDVSIAHDVMILSTSHRFDSPDIPIKYSGMDNQKTVISNNVWIGAKAVILCGNTIGSGSVIAAGAVVTHDVPPNTVVAGVPAVPIKTR